MDEQTILAVEGAQSRATIAAYFRQFADALAADGVVTFSTDTDEVELTVPEMPDFEVEIEQEIEDDGTEYEIEFEIEWSTADHDGEPAAGSLGIGAELDEEQETIEEAIDDAESDKPAASGLSADDEAQMRQPEGDADSESDADMEPVDPPNGRSEVDAAEDDNGSQNSETDTQ